MIDWQDLHYFAVLARTGSLSAAARELGVDHATVGRRVAALENMLDLRLIHRLPRSTSLTNDGLAISALAQGMEQSVHDIDRVARRLSKSTVATVRISAPPAVAVKLIAPHVAAFHDANPEIMLVLSGTAQNAALDRGEADIAIRMAKPEAAELLIRRIGAMHFGLYATTVVASGPEQGLKFIAYDAALDHLDQQVWLRAILAGRSIVFQASDLFGQLEAARAGLGAAVLPRFMGDSDPMLVELKTSVPPPVRDLWLTTYSDLRKVPAIRLVMTFLADIIGKACPMR
ncbi:LysR family transcriptional regulator [Phyllobacterium sp. YR531]|uniref:LysR family transcriptional regulator n=1 Tax=Phyllobacterium sp. YR531 TaxID=1144343 RepID=UPI0002EE3199|nr:LysR family transcriptional regulator [Phyllobacterium sp. YR531]